MRKLALAVSSLFALASLAGCASQQAGSTGYSAAGSFTGDCEFGEDCYGPDAYQYTCVFYQPVPAAPARLNIEVSHRHPPTRVVHRGDSNQFNPQPDSGSSASASAPSVSIAPPSIAREPVVMASPSGDRSARPH